MSDALGCAEQKNLRGTREMACDLFGRGRRARVCYCEISEDCAISYRET